MLKYLNNDKYTEIFISFSYTEQSVLDQYHAELK